MQALRNILLLLICVSLAGCYHARIETGLTPSAQVIDIPFAMGWVYGLVPPGTVKAAGQCSNGVAIVETEHSFVNSLVAGLTFGIFTPIHIKVTCATNGAMGVNETEGAYVVFSVSSGDEVVASFEAAANEAVETGKQIYVRFE